MDTYFLPPERVSRPELLKEIEVLSRNSIIDGLLHSVSGLLAVLNEHRQILAVNQALLDMLQIEKPEEALGLRPGEALKCVHAHEMPGGCGTSRYCSTCGSAIAIATSMTRDTPVEKECALEAVKGGEKLDLYLRIRCAPVMHENKKLLLLFIQDITHQQKLAALERVFFHDITGLLQGLVSASELLCLNADNGDGELLQAVHRLSLRLAGEISMQRTLTQGYSASYQPVHTSTRVSQIVEEIRYTYLNHSAALNKRLILPEQCHDQVIKTEPTMLLRVLKNMITNALEATPDGGKVRLWIDEGHDRIVFCVGNEKPIPEDIAKRIFQRNFSTKSTMGRGLGTYSMKLFGEEILGGTVNFTSSETDGTVFRFSLKK